jgi:CDP-diacylglycerol---glycerol-3-phosphate 3-phosphatidyltransferase
MDRVPFVSLTSLPNQVTLSRLVLAIGMFVLIDRQLWIAALVVLAIASVTDWLDGYLARRMKMTSALGRILDPLVDKVWICGAYVFLLPFADAGLAPWMTTLVVSRELIITGLRSYLEGQGAVFGADFLGKAKTTAQIAAVVAIFVRLEYPNPTFSVIRDVFIWLMLALTAASGIQYLVRAALLVRR